MDALLLFLEYMDRQTRLVRVLWWKISISINVQTIEYSSMTVNPSLMISNSPLLMYRFSPRTIKIVFCGVLGAPCTIKKLDYKKQF